MSEVETTTRALIEGDGYAKLPRLISPEAAERIRQQMLEEVANADQHKDIHLDKGQARVTGLLHRGEVFEDLVTNPRLLALAHGLLGDDATLASFSARVLNPGCEIGGLHVDYPYWAMDPGMPVDPPLMMQVIWMMEPFTPTNGGTWVAPGSQLWTGKPVPDKFTESAIQATGDAGDALVSHGLLWHRTAVNQAAEPRVAVLINYTQLTVRPMAPLAPFSDELLERASPELRGLLALNYGASLMRRLGY